MDKETTKQHRRKSHIKNLLRVALADSQLNHLEEAFLFARAASLKLSAEDVRKIIKTPASVSFCPPVKFGNKLLQMHDLVYMMLLDGKIHEEELKICQEIAAKFNLMPEVVHQIVRSILKPPTCYNEPVKVMY